MILVDSTEFSYPKYAAGGLTVAQRDKSAGQSDGHGRPEQNEFTESLRALYRKQIEKYHRQRYTGKK